MRLIEIGNIPERSSPLRSRGVVGMELIAPQPDPGSGWHYPPDHGVIATSAMTAQCPATKENESAKTPIALISGGGTIGSVVTDRGRAGGGGLDLIALLRQRNPKSIPNVDIIHQITAYDGLSENINEEIQAKILKIVTDVILLRPKAIVLTHGTDTMELTARFLQEKLLHLLQEFQCSIIMTGANEDSSHPHTDAWDNLTYSMKCAQKDLKPGVYIAFHGRLIPAQYAVKEPYHGEPMHYISTQSDEYRELKRLQRKHDALSIKKMKKHLGPQRLSSDAAIHYPVNHIPLSHDGLMAELTMSGATAVVLRLYHSGTAITEDGVCSVADLVRALNEMGLVVFGVTENSEPIRNARGYTTSDALLDAGMVPVSMDLRVLMAKLRLLGKITNPVALIQTILTDVAGEITHPLDPTEKYRLLQHYAQIPRGK